MRGYEAGGGGGGGGREKGRALGQNSAARIE